MRYRLTADDIQDIDFLRHPLHDIDDYQVRRKVLYAQLEQASTAVQFYTYLGNLEANAQRGCCSLDERMARVLLQDIGDEIRKGKMYVPALSSPRAGSGLFKIESAFPVYN